MDFSPTSGSMPNMVEVFFGIITRQAIRPGTVTSGKDLIAAVETYIAAGNERPTTRDHLTKASAGRTS